MNILKKSVSFLTAVAVILLSAMVFSVFPENNNRTASAYSIDSYADDVAALVNEYRQQQGIEPLKVIPLLQENAQTRAVEISEEFSHTRPDGTMCFTAISSSLSYYACAENIAYGETTPEAVIKQWKKSDGHNKNMLNSEYTHIGVGVYESNYTVYWVQVFIGSSSTYDDEYTPVYSSEDTTGTIKPTEEYTTEPYTEDYTYPATEEYTTEPYTEGYTYPATEEYTTEPYTEDYTYPATEEYSTEPYTEGYTYPATEEYTTEPYTEDYTYPATEEYTTEPYTEIYTYSTIKYTTETDSVSMWGDVTFDGRVSIADAVLLNKYLVNSATITKQGRLNADCWYDGTLTADDTVTIQKILVGTYSQTDMPIIPYN